MPLRSTFTRFFQLEAASGLLLIAAAALALIINNSPLSHYYTAFLDVPVAVQIGALQIAKPSLLWINDGLMALFFLLIGLEVKRELLEGQLSKPSQVVLPGGAAIGGMVVPALIYWFINKDFPDALDGWAIPMATDIAFALGVLALLGKRVPVSLKLFLMTLAFCIPLRTKNSEPSPLMGIEHALHPWVAYAILPLFAFANAGVSLTGVNLHSFTHHVPLGIAAGLLIGKTVGVFGFTWIAIKTGMAALPNGANWGQVFGVAILCGIGFTMSLFVGSLAFVPGSSDYVGMDRMGILTGSILAALIGYAVTAAFSRKQPAL